jgi:urea transport system permease protein
MGHVAIIAGQIFNGFSVGSILLLIALGLALSFGLMNVINVAQGEMLMVDGYLSYLACRIVHGPCLCYSHSFLPSSALPC